MTRHHADTCEADTGHDNDCGTASELARLRAFAEAVRDDVGCAGHIPVVTDDDEAMAQQLADHLADCLHCAALQALGQAR